MSPSEVVDKFVKGTEPKLKVKAQFEIKKGDTASAIVLKCYGSAAKGKWKAMSEANKAVIGDNPGAIRAGQAPQIPELWPGSLWSEICGAAPVGTGRGLELVRAARGQAGTNTCWRRLCTGVSGVRR
ncbi:MAG: hypothetical protein MUO23_08200 [Anaerolineales bacterium]|nr:hypothetical protein [Anaerolineales bacterium]